MNTVSVVLTAAAQNPGSEPVAWWLRFGLIVAGLCAVAALMVLMQTRHRQPRLAIWVLVIFFIPIIGPLTYLIVQTVIYHRSHPRPTKGPSERMAPEDISPEERAAEGVPPEHDDDGAPGAGRDTGR